MEQEWIQGRKKFQDRSYVREIIVIYIKNKNKNNMKTFVIIGDCTFPFNNKPIYINA